MSTWWTIFAIIIAIALIIAVRQIAIHIKISIEFKFAWYTNTFAEWKPLKMVNMQTACSTINKNIHSKCHIWLHTQNAFPRIPCRPKLKLKYYLLSKRCVTPDINAKFDPLISIDNWIWWLVNVMKTIVKCILWSVHTTHYTHTRSCVYTSRSRDLCIKWRELCIFRHLLLSKFFLQ